METGFSSFSSSSYNSSVLLMLRLFVDLSPPLPPLHMQKHRFWLRPKLRLTVLLLPAPRTSQVCHPVNFIRIFIGVRDADGQSSGYVR